MKLYDYLKLMPENEELTVWDKDYDTEFYFYRYVDEEDRWETALSNLAKLLDITEIEHNGVIVNLSEIIEENMPKLKAADLFIRCDIDSIMEDIESILAGNVSETWLEKFVEVLHEHS